MKSCQGKRCQSRNFVVLRISNTKLDKTTEMMKNPAETNNHELSLINSVSNNIVSFVLLIEDIMKMLIIYQYNIGKTGEN